MSTQSDDNSILEESTIVKVATGVMAATGTVRLIMAYPSPEAIIGTAAILALLGVVHLYTKIDKQE